MNENQLAEKLPDFFYGTAWKEEKTKELTRLALIRDFELSTPPIKGVTTSKRRSERGFKVF